MSDAVTCDSCGKTAARQGLVSWYRVDVPDGSYEVTTYARKAMPWDFCSPECAAAYLLAHAG